MSNGSGRFGPRSTKAVQVIDFLTMKHVSGTPISVLSDISTSISTGVLQFTDGDVHLGKKKIGISLLKDIRMRAPVGPIKT